MLHSVRSLPSRTRLALLLGALVAATITALALAPGASAWYCPPGTYESPPDSGQCVSQQPTTTPETPAPQPAKPEQPSQPPTKPEQPQQPTTPQTPPAAVPAPQTPPAAAPAPQTPPAAAPAPQTPPTPAPVAAPAPAQSVTPPSAAPQENVQAQAPTEAQRPSHERPSSAVQGEVVTGASAPVTPQSAPAQLPFTGVDVGLIALIGIVLLTVGLLLRRHRIAVRSARGEIVAMRADLAS
jgi:outer membrane biosynthesis protein TonB